jgi:hypothetical protein
MNVQTKSDVWFKEINDFTIHFLQTLDDIWTKWGNVPFVTSAADGQHMDGSYHYINQAWDIRIWGLKNPEEMMKDLKNNLEADGNEWRVLNETDHIHVEVHPK